MDIPYTIEGVARGHLSPMEKRPPYTWFHVFVYEPDGTYYRGQLLFHHGAWHLPDSSLEPYAEELGNLVEAWYG